MGACSGCKRNCCIKTGGSNLELTGLDCLKLIDYFLGERLVDSGWSSKSSLFSGFSVYYNGRSVFRLNNYWGYLSGDLVKPQSSPCFFLSSDSCRMYNSVVRDSGLSDWLVSNELSVNVRPLTCRGFPFFVYDPRLFENRDSTGWVEDSVTILNYTFESGCKVAGSCLDGRVRESLRRETLVAIKCDSSAFSSLIKGDFVPVIDCNNDLFKQYSSVKEVLV